MNDLKFKRADPKYAEGTYLGGFVVASYQQLINLFGEHEEGDGYKSSTEWTLRDNNGNVLTVYDYKATKLYSREPILNLPTVEEFRESGAYKWHIGGKNQRAVNRLIEYIEQKINEKIIVS